MTGLRVPGALHAALVAHLPGVTRLALRKVRFASRADLVALVASFLLLEALSFDLVRFEAKDEGASVGVGAPLPRTLRSLEVVRRVREPLLGWLCDPHVRLESLVLRIYTQADANYCLTMLQTFGSTLKKLDLHVDTKEALEGTAFLRPSSSIVLSHGMH